MEQSEIVMNRILIGKVSKEERDEIKSLHMRRSALLDLSQILTAENSELHKKLIEDLAEINANFHEWWVSKVKEHNWERSEKGRWQIDFNTCEIFLIQQ